MAVYNSHEALRLAADENNYIEGTVIVSLFDLIKGGSEQSQDLLSELLIGSYLLMDMSWQIDRYFTDGLGGDEIALVVRGDCTAELELERGETDGT